jgi:hypothetical protein
MGATPDYIEQSLKAIRNAESELQALFSKAGAARDYASAAKIMASAKALQEVAEALAEEVNVESTTKRASQKTGTYPRFFRSLDNKLIVIGWSEKTNTEYEHKAPKIVLERLISVLLEQSNGEALSMEKMTVHSKMNDQESKFPEYYLRSFLRWLKSIGLIVKHGHQGYSVKNPDTFKENVNSQWKKLPVH